SAADDRAAEVEAARLSYPWKHGPEVGEYIEVAPGVRWLRMPMGGRLAFINIWAIRDGAGWAIVDTGLGNEATTEAWRKAFKSVLDGLPITRVFVTHLHPDHIGMSGWLTRRFDCMLWITRQEFLMCRSLASDSGRDAPEDGVRFYRRAGWDEEAIETYRARFGGFGNSLRPLPDSFRRIQDRERIRIGDHEWEVVVGSGHSPEHGCLWCPDLKLFISGDQVLPKISSNVSVHPPEPEGDPLTEWLTTLAAIKTRVPHDVLVLPAHNEPFYGLHHRVDGLIGGHERGLARLMGMLDEPKRVIDVFRALFRRQITEEVLSMA